MCKEKDLYPACKKGREKEHGKKDHICDRKPR